jgi:ubiquitin C-terminal hydrolase
LTYLYFETFLQIFSGAMLSELRCTHCDNRSCKLEQFLDISLSLDLTNSGITSSLGAESTSTSESVEEKSSVFTDQEMNNDMITEESSQKADEDKEGISLTRCLQHFTSLEMLSEQIFCDACQVPRPAKKRLSLFVAPRVLVLHFKRFDSLRQVKICSKVLFPARGLDLTPFMHTSQPTASSDHVTTPVQNHFIYDLQGVVSHKGSLTQGHYISYVNMTADSPESPPSWMR